MKERCGLDRLVTGVSTGRCHVPRFRCLALCPAVGRFLRAIEIELLSRCMRATNRLDESVAFVAWVENQFLPQPES